MATTPMLSTAQKGKKLSFADFITLLSPQDTVFQTSIGSVSIDQTSFKWQTDVLDPVGANAVLEGSDAGDWTPRPTVEIDNQTQILRKVVKVSDTADKTANYGRGGEMNYQMTKAGKSIKRDLEAALLGNGPKGSVTTATDGAVVGAKTFGGFRALVGTTGAGHSVNETGHTGTQADPDTGAVVVKDAAVATAVGTASATNPLQVLAADNAEFEAALIGMTAELYKANSDANVIMAHPSMAGAFSMLLERGTGEANRVRYFENTKNLDLEVNTITTPLGKTFKIVYDRFMPVTAAGETPIYLFNASDWDQMVFRAPQKIALAKTGSAETWMIELETSLRHRHPYASAVLNIKAK